MDFLKKKREAKGRLATGEIHALAGQHIQNAAAHNRDLVIQRIERERNITGPLAEWARDNMISLLQKAELTINFKAYEFFNIPPAKSYQNYFQRNRDYGGYGTTRENTEQKLFKYSAPASLTNIQEVIDRIMKRGNHNDGVNRSFAPTVRPRYGALNVMGDPAGPSSAHLYGTSVFVLKEYMKHKCTFTYGDSFSYNSIPDTHFVNPLANYLYLDRVLVDMDRRTFECLYKKAHKMALKQGETRGHRYIEAQIHNDIVFSRDVETIRVSKTELKIGNNDQQLRDRIEAIALFAIRNGIKVETIP